MLTPFVTGIFRSGTTLTARVLSAHPEIRIYYQPLFPFFKMWRNLLLAAQGFSPSERDRPMGTEVTKGYDLVDLLTAKGLTVYFSKADTSKLSLALAEERLYHSEEKEQLPEDFFAALQPGTAEEIFTQLLERLRKHAGNKTGIVGIKEIWCEEFIAALALLPRIEIKSLLIIRDPRAVFASRNTGRYLTSCEGKRYPLRFISQTWLRSCCLAHHLSREKKCLVLRYEDLVQEPGRTCDEICAYLGIPMDSVMLAPEQWLDGNGKPWQPNTTGSTGNSGFNQKPLTYWQQALTKAEIGAIEHLCGSEMEAQGYARATTIIEAEQLAGEYTEDPKQLQPWLAQQGYLWDSGQHVEFTQEKPHEG